MVQLLSIGFMFRRRNKLERFQLNYCILVFDTSRLADCEATFSKTSSELKQKVIKIARILIILNRFYIFIANALLFYLNSF